MPHHRACAALGSATAQHKPYLIPVIAVAARAIADDLYLGGPSGHVGKNAPPECRFVCAMRANTRSDKLVIADDESFALPQTQYLTLAPKACVQPVACVTY